MTRDEIAAELASIKAHLEHIGVDVNETKDLAKTTNGRVTALEKSRERDKGFLAAIALLMPIATAILSAWIATSIF